MLSIPIIAVLAATLAPSPASAPHHRTSKPVVHAVAQRPSLADPSDVFSLRARRRFAAYIRMRLLEMREAELERAADIVQRGLTVDGLLAPPK